VVRDIGALSQYHPFASFTMKAAFVTLLTRESYLAGTLVLNYSLKSVGSKYEPVVMVTPELSERARDVLSKEKITIKEIARLDPREGSHTLEAHDARFKDTWTKLRLVISH
jgi:hypothetical protein